MRGPLALLALVLAGLVLWTVPASQAAGAVRSEFFGVGQRAPWTEEDLQAMAALRVRTNRFMLFWGSIQPTQGSFNWGPTDQLVGSLASKGIRSLPAVWGNPDWVAGSNSTPPIGGPAGVQAWSAFLKAAVARYRPGGSYWVNRYHQQFGATAPVLPIQSWQIWNEPNLQKYFAPQPSAGQYSRLLQISHDAIKSRDPRAQIVLAGMTGWGDVTAWDFLSSLYSISGIKADFDVAALHPYASTLDRLRQAIVRFRTVMANHADAATPLWITEIAWGSAPPDQYGINKGPFGQKQMLIDSYDMILDNRRPWNVQRVFWYRLRDPANPTATCSFCASAGLINYNHTPKASYYALRAFSAEMTPPTVTITGGPAQGGFTRDPTPTFTFTSNEHGSTFVCRFDGQAFTPCVSPITRSPAFSNGPHSFSVQAIDAPGNQSAIVTRSFTVDTQAPAAPQITDTDPDSPANFNTPKVKGSAEPASLVKLYKTTGCTGAPVAQGWAGLFATPGIAVSVPDNTSTAFRARATDRAGNTSACSAPRYYVEDSTP
jgi:hypothetical protein